MLGLKDLFNQQEEIGNVIAGVNEGLREQLVAGLSGSARTLFIASVYEKTKRQILIVTHNLLQAQKLFDDLVHVVGEEDVFLYPANELIGAEISVASPELKAQRIEVLNHLSKQKSSIVIVPIAGMRKLVPPPALWKQYQLTLKVGDVLSIEQQLLQFVEMGYVRTEMITSPGEFSVRGGIIDIYPLTETNPIRIELFDTDIDSIRTFSLEDQRSIEKCSEMTIGPATEIPFREEQYARLVGKLETGLKDSLNQVKDESVKTQLVQNIGYELEQLKNRQKPEQLFKYLSISYDPVSSLIDY